MTTTIIFANTTDGELQCDHATYATALAGGGTFNTSPTGNSMSWGQRHNGSTYEVKEIFLEFPYTLDSTLAIAAAYFNITVFSTNGTGVSRDLEIREFDWGGSLTSVDWRTPSQFGALNLLATITNAEDAGADTKALGGSDALLTRLGATGTVRVVATSSRVRTSTSPGTFGEESSSIYQADWLGTASDPALIYTTVSKSRLFGVLGAQVQLSDGTHAYLESQNEAGSSVLLKHHNGTSTSTVATIPIGTTATDFVASKGSQSFALVVDASDNLYVIGALGSSPGATLAGKAYTKGVGYTWTAQTLRSAAMPSYTDGSLNNFAGAWHNQGTNGTIMVVAAHTAGRAPNTTGDIVYALLNCQYLLTGTGSLLRASGSARGVVVSSSTKSGSYTGYANETGSLLDVVAAPGTTDRGYVLTAGATLELGDSGVPSAYRYQLAAGGTSLADTDSGTATMAALVKKDAAAKSRVLGIDGTVFAAVCTDPTNGWGITAEVLQNFGISNTFTSLGRVKLDAQGIASMPSEATLAASQAWDVMYDPGNEKLWVYYFDTANAQRLMRTSVDMNTYLAAGDEVQVSAAVGAVGSTNYAIRVHRGETQGQQVLIAVANKTSGGTHSTIYVTDTINVAPNAPTLTPEPNYDAAAAATFQWTFSDPNAGDTQSAYQLQIVDVSDGSVDVDTGKVASSTASRTVAGGTLVNEKSYQWRVKTWDALDAEGPYSSYGTFQTSASGAVTIIDPATDNPAGVNTDDYLVQWSVAGTTQAAYRVKVVRTSNSSVLSDTGWVTSTATSHLIAGMLTGVEYRIEVTVRNAALVESGTVTRLITPDYDNVPQPTITVTAFDSAGYVLVTVTNPSPTGDDPAATSNVILRRVSGTTGSYEVVGSCDLDDTFRDYTAASGVTYEYVARGTA